MTSPGGRWGAGMMPRARCSAGSSPLTCSARGLARGRRPRPEIAAPNRVSGPVRDQHRHARAAVAVAQGDLRLGDPRPPRCEQQVRRHGVHPAPNADYRLVHEDGWPAGKFQAAARGSAAARLPALAAARSDDGGQHGDALAAHLLIWPIRQGHFNSSVRLWSPLVMITAVLDDASGDLADVLDPVATAARSTVAAHRPVPDPG